MRGQAALMLRAALATLLVLLGACSSTVVTQVNEFDANEVISLLMNYGVPARKVSGTEQNFDVLVAQEDLGRALTLLVDAGLPREKRDSLGELFKREGMVSTATEEHIRYVYGLSKELERTISTMDGVASARVHIVIPQPDPYAITRRPSSASVLIRYRTPADPLAFGPLVRSLIVRAVEGLEPEQVAVALAPIPQAGTHLPSYAAVLGLKMAPESAEPAMAMLMAPWALLLLVLAWLARSPVWKWLRRMAAHVRAWRPGAKRPPPLQDDGPQAEAGSRDAR